MRYTWSVAPRAAARLVSALALALAGAWGAACGDEPRTRAAAPPVYVPDASVVPDAAPAAAPFVVHVLALSDFHGALDASTASGLGGAEYLAAHVARRSTGASIFVGAGDLVGASPLASGYFHDEGAVEALSAAGLALSGLGNHELDEGLPELLRLQRGGCHPVDGCRAAATFAGARFRYLAANVRERATGETIFAPYEIRTFGPARIAFVGMTLQGTPQTTLASSVAGLDFAEEVSTMNALLPRILAEGATAIVLLLHQGSRQTGSIDACDGLSGPIADLARRLPAEVRVVVSGHSHVAYNCLLSNKIVTNSGAKGQVLTDIELRFDRASGAYTGGAARNVPVTHDVPPDPAVLAVVDRYRSLVAPIAREAVGSLAAPLRRAESLAGESALGAVVADSMLAATAAAPALADVALMNSGGLRADLPAGELTYGAAYEALPFANPLATVSLNGGELLGFLESNLSSPLQVAGMTYAYDPTAPASARIAAADVVIGGAPLSLAGTYRVTVSAYLFDRLAIGTGKVTSGADLDAFVTYARARSPLAPPATPRITLR